MEQIANRDELGDEQRRQTRGLMVDINWMAEELENRQQTIEQLKQRLTIVKRKSLKKATDGEADDKQQDEDANKPQGISAKIQNRAKAGGADVGERVMGSNGPECASQTNIVGAHGGFYLL